jgi:hypothetical protein
VENVDVTVDETGRDRASSRIDHLSASRRLEVPLLANAPDATVRDLNETSLDDFAAAPGHNAPTGQEHLPNVRHCDFLHSVELLSDERPDPQGLIIRRCSPCGFLLLARDRFRRRAGPVSLCFRV